MTVAFEQFWQLYPRKEGKAACLRKWAQKQLDDHVVVIVEHLKRRVHDDRKWRDGFVPMPLTFLNQERWTDEYERLVVRSARAGVPEPVLPVVPPQPCRWQAAANRLLLSVLMIERGVDAARLEKMVARKQEMGRRLATLFGDHEAPAAQWQKISQEGLAWLRNTR